VSKSPDTVRAHFSYSSMVTSDRSGSCSGAARTKRDWEAFLTACFLSHGGVLGGKADFLCRVVILLGKGVRGQFDDDITSLWLWWAKMAAAQPAPRPSNYHFNAFKYSSVFVFIFLLSSFAFGVVFRGIKGGGLLSARSRGRHSRFPQPSGLCSQGQSASSSWWSSIRFTLQTFLPTQKFVCLTC
jgi:hypothetical protein